jgi:putative endonuclease
MASVISIENHLSLSKHTLSNRILIGRWAEELVSLYIVSKGFQLLDRNIYTKFGEADIIALNISKNSHRLIEVRCKVLSINNNLNEDLISLSLPRRKRFKLRCLALYLGYKYSELVVDFALVLIDKNTQKVRLLYTKDIFTYFA